MPLDNLVRKEDTILYDMFPLHLYLSFYSIFTIIYVIRKLFSRVFIFDLVVAEGLEMFLYNFNCIQILYLQEKKHENYMVVKELN